MIEILKFDISFDCIVCLNAPMPSLGFFLDFKNIPVIGADGGAVRLFEKGIICDYVVGDLDAFRKAKVENFFDKAKIVHEPSQDINDFEKSLIFCSKLGFFNILVLGFHGGELEHTLNNWSILYKFHERMNLCIYENNRYAIPLSKSIELGTTKNEMISIIPQPKAKLRTKNLKWELNSEYLEIGKREGARNVSIGEWIQIEILEGSILLFFDARLPFAYRKVKKSGPDEIRTHDL
ncbi:MAG: thiamine diphosphokinase [Ignavibacteria bacterium]|nr:thiamine diphosphokinase [Ignavibacteria bacterium]